MPAISDSQKSCRSSMCCIRFFARAECTRRSPWANKLRCWWIRANWASKSAIMSSWDSYRMRRVPLVTWRRTTPRRSKARVASMKRWRSSVRSSVAAVRSAHTESGEQYAFAGALSTVCLSRLDRVQQDEAGGVVQRVRQHARVEAAGALVRPRQQRAEDEDTDCQASHLRWSHPRGHQVRGSEQAARDEVGE